MKNGIPWMYIALGENLHPLRPKPELLLPQPPIIPPIKDDNYSSHRVKP